MRLKLLFENIKHHLILTCFIILSFIIINITLMLSIEIGSFTYYTSHEEYQNIHNDFDIIIKSNTGLSLKGTRGENNQFDNSYLRRVGFYNVTLFVEHNEIMNAVSIFEGTNDSFKSAFNLNCELKQNETAITKLFAENNNIQIGDEISINIGPNKIKYKVSNIIEGSGLLSGEHILITGYNISEMYAFRNMYNLVLLDVDDTVDYQEVLTNIKSAYKNYSVIDVHDKETIESLSNSTLSEMMILISGLFIIIIFVLMNLFDQKTKKQLEYFNSIGKSQYALSIKFLYYLFILFISILAAALSVHIIFAQLIKLYQCDSLYIIRFKAVIYSFLISLVIILFKVFVKFKKEFNLRKYYLLILLFLNLICLIIYLVFRNSMYYSLILTIFVLLLTLLILELVYKLTRYIFQVKYRVYIYDISSKNFISTILQFSYIFIVLVISICFSSITIYNNQIKECDNLVNFDEIIVTKVMLNNNENYEQIRISDKGRLFDRNLEIIVSVDSAGYEKYINFGTLSNDEKKLFDSDTKYIVLSKYYQNIYGLNVGDQITLNVNEKDEQYEILKFVNHVYKKIVIVNQSESLYYGYIIDNVNLNDIVMQEFESYPYNIINLQDKMVAYQHIVLSTINVVTILLTSIIILIILFSIYLSYQEYVYNYTNLKKLKLIGYSNKLMFKVSLTKLVYNIVVIILLALFSGFYILSNIDKLMSLLNTIMYIEFDIKLLSISLLISISALLIGYVYSIIKYFKIK